MASIKSMVTVGVAAVILAGSVFVAIPTADAAITTHTHKAVVHHPKKIHSSKHSRKFVKSSLKKTHTSKHHRITARTGHGKHTSPTAVSTKAA